jgi:hypothetical protein
MEPEAWLPYSQQVVIRLHSEPGEFSLPLQYYFL